ncbi:bifunctional Calcium permeable stress-gated cation channel 1-like/10TM putative phosphate transporter [Babesia duncani]|uniref:Bifunctional Calcium permeable stress-gated cation channel 1-like/10TM putative phosphate transporter n=1 Tax=Babesia duncani TaxID=323732 RepID=A0AAD9PK70_9APIC|nr:bifunctional Calcium permeable stress-gated cation channel 1-like/10TM putative phosphate transporter [Babesia duncani]
MDKGVWGFLAIMCFDITVFAISIYIWSSYRNILRSLLHSGFVKVRLSSCRRDAKAFDHLIQNELKQSGLFNPLDDENSKDPSMQPTDGGVKGYFKPKKANWWYYLTRGDEDKLSNNEAKLYLQFLWSIFVMLIWCTVISFIINGIVYMYLRSNGQSYFIISYNIEDLINSKVTIWSLYFTTWIYSAIVYFNILRFRTFTIKRKQVTVVLRPQLHTIMVVGFDKAIVDPSVIYKYFERIFPNQVLAAHLVFNHSKRLLLEWKLENAKVQLCAFDYYPPNATLETPPNAAEPDGPTSPDESGPDVGVQKSKAVPKMVRCKTETYDPKDSESNDQAEKEYRHQVRKSISLLDTQIVDPSTTLPQSPQGPRKSLSSSDILRFSSKQSQTQEGEMDAATLEKRPRLSSRSSFMKQFAVIRNLKAKIDAERTKSFKSSAKICFVSFADSNIVIHIIKDRKILEAMPKWRIYAAPHPRDIVWDNLHLTPFCVGIRCLVINVLLVLFYVLVGYILSSMNLLHTYKKPAPKIDLPEQAPPHPIGQVVTPNFWSNLIPPVTMAVINTCVHPPLINFASRYVGFWLQSTCQKYLLFGHIFYLIISTILVPLVASMLAFWKIFDGEFDSLSVEIGGILMNTSWRFATVYLLNATFLGTSNQLLQVSQLFCRWFVQRVFKYDFGVANFDFGYWYAFHLSILTLIMLFAIFVPYLLILGTAYFGIRYLIDRYNIMNEVWQLQMDSEGNVSATAIKSMLISISLFQFAMSGVFLSCQEKIATIWSTLLYIASAATWLFIYESNSEFIANLDQLYKIQLKPLDKKMLNTIKVCYMHPCDASDLVNI